MSNTLPNARIDVFCNRISNAPYSHAEKQNRIITLPYFERTDISRLYFERIGRIQPNNRSIEAHFSPFTESDVVAR